MSPGPPLEADLWPLVQPLWDYLALAETPRSADVIFVFGSRDLAVPARPPALVSRGTCAAGAADRQLRTHDQGCLPQTRGAGLQGSARRGRCPPVGDFDRTGGHEHAGERAAQDRNASEGRSTAGHCAPRGQGVCHAPLRRDVRPAVFRHSSARLSSGMVERRRRSTGARPSSRHGSSPRSTGWSGTPSRVTSGLRRFRWWFARRPPGSRCGSHPEHGDNRATQYRATQPEHRRRQTG